jgi:hypothetical protein
VSPRDAALITAWAVGLGRAATGAWFVSAPNGPERNWVARELTETRYLVRSVGGRDLAIGLGVIAALARRQPVQPWLLASIGSDLVDAVMGGLMLEGEPRRKSLGYALGFGALGAAAAAALAATRD